MAADPHWAEQGRLVEANRLMKADQKVDEHAAQTIYINLDVGYIQRMDPAEAGLLEQQIVPDQATGIRELSILFCPHIGDMRDAYLSIFKNGYGGY